MKALILNSGMGSRMDSLTKDQPKCMTALSDKETIISRQLSILQDCGIKDVVITTGYYDDVLIKYCRSLNSSMNLHFVNNPDYATTNYIYSIYCARDLLKDDIILMHGDLVFEKAVFQAVLDFDKSCVVVERDIPLPEKDFKAVISEGFVKKIGVEFFDSAVASQPLYKFQSPDWKVWLSEIISYCESGKLKVYAENALNDVTDRIQLYPLDLKGLCHEVDTQEDLKEVLCRL